MMKRWLPWIGWLLSIGAVSILLMSARWKLTFDPWYVKEWGRIGWDPNMLPRIAVIQLTSVVLYLIPQTAVLGVVLLTGYLGGAISQYTRLEEPYPVLVPLSVALFAWAGLYLREKRLWSLLPFRRPQSQIKNH
jgi:DoxX-like family